MFYNSIKNNIVHHVAGLSSVHIFFKILLNNVIGRAEKTKSDPVFELDSNNSRQLNITFRVLDVDTNILFIDLVF